MIPFRKTLIKLINEIIDGRTVETAAAVLPLGYNPLEKIRGGLFRWAQVPFNGVKVWCELRCMNASQIKSCGNISSIAAAGTGASDTISEEDILKLRNYQEQLIIKTLNKPAFDEIEELIGANDRVIPKIKQDLEELRRIDLKTLKPEERLRIQKIIEEKTLFAGYILPEDTIEFIVSWAMGHDVSDIKKLTDERFLEAAILAVNGNDNPTDHISGIFTDHNKDDMNKYAWSKYAEYLEMKQIEHRANNVMVFGGRKK